MTASEQDRIIGSDFRTRRDAERPLACLDSKKSAIKRNVTQIRRLLDGHGIPAAVTENTLHTHDGRMENRQHQAVCFPSAQGAFDLLIEIADTETLIEEMDRRQAKV